jgi:Dockerin type I domain
MRIPSRFCPQLERLETRILLAGELLALKLDVSQNGASILNENREFAIAVGDRFDLEILFDDLRPEDEREGPVVFHTNIATNLPSAFRPVVSESQFVRVLGDFGSVVDGAIVVSAAGRPNTYTIPVLSTNEVVGLDNDVERALRIAVENVLGLAEGHVRLESISFAEGREDFSIQFVGEEFAFQDIPNLSFDASGLLGAVITTEVVEQPAFVNGDPLHGVNLDQILTSLDFRSRSLGGGQPYVTEKSATYAATSDVAFADVGGASFASPKNLAESRSIPFTGQNFKAFSIRLEAVAPAAGIDFSAGVPLQSHQVLIDDGGSATVTGMFTPARRFHVSAGTNSTIKRDHDRLVVVSDEIEVLRSPFHEISSLSVNSSQSAMFVTLDYRDGSPIPFHRLTMEGTGHALKIVGPASELDLTGSVVFSGFTQIDLSDSHATRLSLDALRVANLSPAAKRIRVLTQDGPDGALDQLDFRDSGDWQMTNPIIEGSAFLLVAMNQATNETVEVLSPRAWQNPITTSDVNNDRSTTASDALRVINELASRKFSDPATNQLADPLSLAQWPGVYFDQNGDGKVTALDALRVVNTISQQSASENELATAHGVQSPIQERQFEAEFSDLTSQRHTASFSIGPTTPITRQSEMKMAGKDFDVDAVDEVFLASEFWCIQPLIGTAVA